MADGDSGIEGEYGNHVEETTTIVTEEVEESRENGVDHVEEETVTQMADPDEDRPVVELFVKVRCPYPTKKVGSFVAFGEEVEAVCFWSGGGGQGHMSTAREGVEFLNCHLAVSTFFRQNLSNW